MTHLQAAGLHQRLDHLAGGAGPGGGFQHDQLAGAQMLADVGGSVHDEGEVGVAVASDGRGHADQDRVGVLHAGEVGGRLQLAAVHGGPHHVGADIADDLLGAVDRGDPSLADVEAQHLEAGADARERERQAHIAQADDADDRVARFQALQKRVELRGFVRQRVSFQDRSGSSLNTPRFQTHEGVEARGASRGASLLRRSRSWKVNAGKRCRFHVLPHGPDSFCEPCPRPDALGAGSA